MSLIVQGSLCEKVQSVVLPWGGMYGENQSERKMDIISFTDIGFKWYFPHIIELGQGIQLRLILIRVWKLTPQSLKYNFQILLEHSNCRPIKL